MKTCFNFPTRIISVYAIRHMLEFIEATGSLFRNGTVLKDKEFQLNLNQS